MTSECLQDFGIFELLDNVTYNFGDFVTQRRTFRGTGPFFPDTLGKTRSVFTGSHDHRGTQF